MYKKVISFFVMLSLLIPTPMFALESNESFDSEDNGSVVEYDIMSESEGNNTFGDESGNSGLTDTDSQSDDVVNSDLNGGNTTPSNEGDKVDEEEVVEPEIQAAQVKNCTISSTGVTSCRVTWEKVDCSRVNISYSYTGFEKTYSSSSGYYVIRDIPFGEVVTVVLSTDELHEKVTLTCNPSDDYTPVNVVSDKDSVLFRPSANKANAYSSNFDVMTKKGTVVPSFYYTRKSDTINSPGLYKVDVVFKDAYAKYKPLHYDLLLLPNEPTIHYISWFQKSNSLDFRVSGRYEDYNKIVVKIATDKDCKNVVETLVKKKEKNKNTSSFKVKGLKANTQYYVKAYKVKTFKSKDYKSASVMQPMHTTKSVKYSTRQSDVLKILSLMNKNKTFTYTFNSYYSFDSVSAICHGLSDNYPQYSYRYNRGYVFKRGNMSVKFKYNSKAAAKQKKLTKKINSIVSGAKKKKGTCAKVKYINKRICQTCSYHWAAYKAHKKGKYPKKYEHCHDAYGCLVQHKAVCSGYTDAFNAICVQLNIPTSYGHGKNHIWNKVKIGKKWYHVDVTWNDCTHSTRWLLKTKHAN